MLKRLLALVLCLSLMLPVLAFADDYDDEDFEPVKREYVPITLDKEEKKEEEA